MTNTPGPVSPAPGASETLAEARASVLENLRRAAGSFPEEGMPRPSLDGKILRPLAAFLAVPPDRRRDLDHRFWTGLLAVEMVHEASLLHDDILDEAPERRGRPTVAAAAGVGAALVLGDHLLTAAYRAAAAVGSCDFLDTFVRSVERTVAGEIAQERSQGRILAEEEYRTIISNKSGELFGAAFALAPTLLGLGAPDAVATLGTRLGCLYQIVDDFLDYCPGTDRGKLPLQDYRQRKWTRPLGVLGARDFRASQEQVLLGLFRLPEGGGTPPLEKAVSGLEGELREILRELAGAGMATTQLEHLTMGWIHRLRRAVREEVERYSPGAHGSLELKDFLSREAEPLGNPAGRLVYFGNHAKSFRFASRLFPAEALDKVAAVYAFCRFTDDLVDQGEGLDPSLLEARLNEWLRLAREAYADRQTGVGLLDEVLGEMGRSGVPFRYVEELVEGVRMDLFPRRFETLQDLRVYSFRVASVVGGWLTELFGVRDPRVLERAYAMGHAMQLTNILRDVGEDLGMGRVYLPEDRMERHGVDRDLLERITRGKSPIPPGYRSLMEELMAEADKDYEEAFMAIPRLPPFFQRPVAVAAQVYRGIHQEIRSNGHDNLTRRARTSLPTKVRLGAGALRGLRALKTQAGPEDLLDRPLREGKTPGGSLEVVA
jgi:15-cis-phytoene synthase